MKISCITLWAGERPSSRDITREGQKFKTCFGHAEGLQRYSLDNSIAKKAPTHACA